MGSVTSNAAASSAGIRNGIAIGTIHPQAFRIVITQAALEEILDYSEQDLQREAGGFLIGVGSATPRRDVEIRHFLPAVQARSRVASLMFTHDTWSAMSREVQRRYPDQSVLGWHHTHPGFGVFLSAYDLFIQRHFFNEPWQMALVVDPRRRELGFFQWLEGQIVDCGFICTEEAGAGETGVG